MEMNELEKAWNGLNERLEGQGERLQQIQRRHGIASARARLRLVSLGQIVQLAIGIGMVLWAGSYWFGHLGQTHLVVYGVAIHLYGLGLLISSALQLTRLAQLDYRQPVLEVQRQLLAIRRLRVDSDRALMICGFLVWVPIACIALRVLGWDVWLTSPATVVWNLAVSAGLAAFVAWLMHRFRGSFERDAVGRSLREAEAEFAQLAQSGGDD
ncbi:MAG: hypothetical protein SGI99_05830 [Pseudomonadota bacterium]|nr:hypothetical protein [Pseudomonadota bacterium]